MSLKTDIEALALHIPKVKADRNYWFVRTDGGAYYDDFINGNYIAIGYEKISLFEIALAMKGNEIEAAINSLTEYVKEVEPNEKRPRYSASQVIKFTQSIKKGDIVIIPSTSSHILHFGEITSTPTYFKEGIDNCPHTKRKKVRWLKWQNKYELEAEFYKMIFTHNAISSANDYEGYIDRTLNTIFIKGDNVHLVLDVTTRNKIDADTYYDFGQVFTLLNDVCENEGIDNKKDFSIKTNVQSPGLIEIIQASAWLIGTLTIGLIINSLVGGKIGINLKANEKDGLDVGLHHDVPVGLIEQISRSLSRKRNDKMKAELLKKSLENMGIEPPKELVKLIENNDKKD